MKQINSTLKLALIAVCLVTVSCNTNSEDHTHHDSLDDDKFSAEERQILQLKIYHFSSNEQVEMVDSYLANAFLPTLNRLKIQPVGVFKPRPGQDSLKKTFVLIPFHSIEQWDNLENQLLMDQDYLSAGSEYLNAPHDQSPYQRIESIVLRAFSDLPALRPTPLESSRPDRIYELRSYESATEKIFANKVDMFNAGGEIKLFEKLEFNAVFYGEVISGSKMPNLMYMTTFSDQESRDVHWDAFRNAPEWLEMKSLPEYQNNVSHIDIHFLYPTEYSDY